MYSRDLYYRHPDLFVKQPVVDRYVDDIACTLGVPRSRLNVVRFQSLQVFSSVDLSKTAAAKGLVAGCFTVQRKDGTRIEGQNEPQVSTPQNMCHHKLTRYRACSYQRLRI
jgi:meiotic recombination protein SPO11